jgi:hypothetical protein
MSDLGLKTDSCNEKIHKWQEFLHTQSGLDPVLTETIWSLVAALEYRNPALVRSRFNHIVEAIRQDVQKRISGVIGTSEIVAKALAAELEDIDPKSYQSVGKSIKADLEQMINTLEQMSAIAASLSRLGYDVENKSPLDLEIQAMRAVKAEILSDWPWEDRPLPPIDRKMVE